MDLGSSDLLGTAAEIAAIFGTGITVADTYSPAGSRLYHRFTIDDEGEIEDLVGALENKSGPILELACGSGRVTLPILRKGYDVVALDSSQEMLNILGERLKLDENAQYSSHCTIINADMTGFALDQKFGTVILGTTMVLLLDQEQRRRLFQCVRDHLHPDGAFLLTLQEFPGIPIDSPPMETTRVFTLGGDDPTVCTFIEYIDPATRARATSILTQQVERGMVVSSAIYTSRTMLLSLQELTDELSSAEMEIVSCHEVSGKHRILRPVNDSWRRRVLLEVKC